MKRIWLCILVLILVLALCGCKSSEVKNVEAMIDAIGTVDEDSIDEIEEAMEAYDDLSEEDKEKVENYADLTGAYDDWLELLIMGEWVDEPFYFYDIEEMYNTVTVTLNEDMTADGEYLFGDWRVEDGELIIDDGEGEYMYSIYLDGDEVYIGSVSYKMMPREKYTALLDDMFVTVELTPENIADYCRIIIFTETEKDAFGAVTGDTNTFATLESTVFKDGLLYMECSDDLAIELLLPEHKSSFTSDGKRWYDSTEEASSQIIQYCPYGGWGSLLGYESKDGYASVHEITADQITFGRVSGKITFIRGDYVKEITNDSTSRVLVLHNGEEIYAGSWTEGINY